MNADELIAKLTWCECDSKLAEDTRRVLRNERMALMAARKAGTITARKLTAVIDLAHQWGVQL